jgi:hypothetical protein
MPRLRAKMAAHWAGKQIRNGSGGTRVFLKEFLINCCAVNAKITAERLPATRRLVSAGIL